MRTTTIALIAGLAALAGQPALAAQDTPSKNTAAVSAPEGQDGEPSEADVMRMMQTLFQVEPLTAEQRARLPQAEAVIARMMPPGSLQQVMGGMFDKIMGPLGTLGSEVDSDTIAKELGAEEEAIDLSGEDAVRIGAILDPARAQRQEAEMAATQKVMKAAMTAMEPGMRKGMAEAYAATFTTIELTDIERFFTTPSGNAFATKSYALASDPRIMAAAMEGVPLMMTEMKAVEADIKATQARLPARRRYADLSAQQRAEIARLTGLNQDAIEAGMARAEAKRAEAASNDGDTDWDADESD